jgi:acyl dehydratase
VVFEHVNDLSDAMIAEAKQLIDQPLRIQQYNHEATYDSIRHYAHGIGDDNPLWCDPIYASRGRYGALVAPPTFFHSVFAPTVIPGFPGLQSFHGGGDYTWRRLARRGESIVASARVTDVQERKGRTVERMILQFNEVDYHTAEGELLAVFQSRSIRTPRPGASGALQYEHQARRSYSPEELSRMQSDILAEEVRGANPRTWEDVKVGDELVPVVKGPLDQVSMICFYAGALPSVGYQGVELAWRDRQLARDYPEQHPNNYDLSLILDHAPAGGGHMDPNIAHAVGMPGAYDNGHQRIGWVAHLVTNWMGDHGFLKFLQTRIRRPNIFGNTTWCRGRVTGKRIDEGEHVVDLDIWTEDQDHVISTTGSASVVLLSKRDNP